jgi:O-antigen/teichoic acid export membrane protein
MPRFVADGSWRGLRRALTAALATSLIGAAPALVLPDLVFSLLFGPGYEPDRAVLGLLCLSATGFGALAVLSQFTIARRLPGSRVVAVGVAATVVTAELVADGPGLLAALQLGASWPAVLVLAARARSRPAIEAVEPDPVAPVDTTRARSSTPLPTRADAGRRAA